MLLKPLREPFIVHANSSVCVIQKNCVKLRSIEFFDEKITMALYLYYSILTPWTVYYMIKIYCGGYVLSACQALMRVNQ